MVEEQLLVLVWCSGCRFVEELTVCWQMSTPSLPNSNACLSSLTLCLLHQQRRLAISEAEKKDYEKAEYRLEKDKSDLKKILNKVGLTCFIHICALYVA